MVEIEANVVVACLSAVSKLLEKSNMLKNGIV